MGPAHRTIRRFARVLTGAGAVLLLLTAVLSIVPAPAGAVTVPVTEPTTTTTITPLQGNPTCRDIGYPSGAKIEGPPVTGEYPGTGRSFEEGSDSLEVTIVDGTDTSFSFTGADPPVNAVIVKSGGNDTPCDEKALLYEFGTAVTAADPIESVTKGDTEVLRDISHVQFCWGETADRPTVEKKWFASDGTTPVAAPTSSDIVVTVDLVEGNDITLGLDQLDDGPYTVPVAASNVAGVDETTVPTGWTEFACDANAEDDAYVFCNKQVEQDDEKATLAKLWFDSDGDLRAAPSSSDIVVTVDLVEGDDIVLGLDDLDDGVVTLPVGVEGVTSVQETTVPSGWRKVECATQYADDADFVLCNRRRSSGGGGGGFDVPIPPTTTTVQPAPILPLTPEVPAEVLPEVITTTAPAPAPVLPFTGSARIEAMAMAGLALVLAGGAATLLARRRPEVDPT